MPRRRPARIALRLFLALATVHLVWQLTGQETSASVSQWFLMPVLIVFLLISTHGATRGRLVTLTLVALGFSWLGDTVPDLATGDMAFLLMVALFLLAQVAYIVALWPHRRRRVLHRRRVLVLPYVVAIGVLVAACAPQAGVLLVPVLATLIQAALFAALVFAFFLFLGWIAVPEATEARWTHGPDDAPRGLLFDLPFSVTLVRVALMLAMFSALNLAAAAASDPAHHRRVVRPMIDEVVRGLDAREAYLAARRGGAK